MNSTKKQPIRQEGFLDFDTKDGIQALVNSMSDVECNRGVLLFSSGIPSFTQTHFVQSKTIIQQVGTHKKSIKRIRIEYIIKGRLNQDSNCILYCPKCEQQLCRNGKGCS